MEEPKQPEIRIFVDADACPVKPEIYRVAERYGLKAYVVANAFMAVPRSDLIERVIVPEGPDVADNWIAERAAETDIVITADIPLAGRCVKNGASVIGPDGQAVHRGFDRDGAGDARPADGSALGGYGDARPAAPEPSRPFAVSVGARFGGYAIEAEVGGTIVGRLTAAFSASS